MKVTRVSTISNTGSSKAFIITMMEFITRLLLSSFLLCAILDFDLVFAERDSPPPAVGSSQDCLASSQDLNAFEALPGIGWDNLQNLDMGLVSARNYSKCIVSGKFLIPDDVLLDPIKRSRLETVAEMFKHWSKFTSTTSTSVNVRVTLNFSNFDISGSFSYETRLVKEKQVRESSETTRVQMRNLRYKVILQAEHAVESAFKSRLLEIASHLQHNNSEYANFLGQLIVRDFGTHYITSVDAGAVLVKLDQVKKKFVSSSREKKQNIKVAAGMSFQEIFNISAVFSHGTDKKVLHEYTTSLTHSIADSHGGPPAMADDWAGHVEDHLVPIDRSGEPLHIAITPRNFPEMSVGSTVQLANVVYKAIKQYYDHNTIAGCTDAESPNFSFHANHEDGSCKGRLYNYTFGGVYQTCTPASSCGYLLQKNPFTSGYSCGKGYRAVLVRRGFSSEQRAFYSTYWCAVSINPPPKQGCFFGGIYSHVLINPITGVHSCPKEFNPLRFGTTMRVCVSDKPGARGSLPFGGFYSCSRGNPLGKSH